MRPSSECCQDLARDGSTMSVSHEVVVKPSKRYPKTPEDEASLAMARLKVRGSEMVAKVRVPPYWPMAYSNSSAFILRRSTRLALAMRRW